MTGGGAAHVLYGMDCSYFTGKLEAYYQTKGLPFRFVELDTRNFRSCAEATGVFQLPCVETPDGEWLTDTTAILDRLESESAGPRLQPSDPAAAFCSLLLEDLFDEWYWRPALYYRWAFDEDARLMSHWIARTLGRDVRLPLFLRQRRILRRQRNVYLKRDGVTPATSATIEALYLDTLRELDAVFARRPFLLGDRPCAADFGLFGPFFRHFFCDPTPGRLMREHGPHVAHWVTRLWKTRPADLEGVPEISSVPDDLGFFFDLIADDYLPYLDANARAVGAGADQVGFRAQGVDWQIPSAPYRVECFNALKRRFAALGDDARARAAARLPVRAIERLSAPPAALEVPTGTGRLRGRLWRPVSALD